MPTASMVRILLSKKRSRNFKKAIAKFQTKSNSNQHKLIRDIKNRLKSK